MRVDVQLHRSHRTDVFAVRRNSNCACGKSVHYHSCRQFSGAFWQPLVHRCARAVRIRLQLRYAQLRYESQISCLPCTKFLLHLPLLQQELGGSHTILGGGLRGRQLLQEQETAASKAHRNKLVHVRLQAICWRVS